MTTSATSLVNQDDEHLRLLAIFHYVVAGMMALFACIPFIHLAVGIFMVVGLSHSKRGDVPPAAAGWLLIIIASVFILAGWTLAGLVAYAGRCLSHRKRHLFCLVVAGVSCLFMPVGTALGVFTIIVLMRPTVKALFDRSSTSAVVG